MAFIFLSFPYMTLEFRYERAEIEKKITQFFSH